MAGIPRIPFARAIDDPRLLKTAWEEFSPDQQALMRMIYGLELSDEDLATWHALHGGATFDDLGYVKSVHDSGVPYIPGREYNDITLIIGRRAAKSCILSFSGTYEALCGGHKARLQKDTEDPQFLLLAQDITRANENKNQYILHYLRSSPAGLSQLQKADDLTRKERAGKGSAITAKQIWLPDCGKIVVVAASLKQRGGATAWAGFDEVAFWSTDGDAANPDTEIERAIRPSLRQFYPYAKLMRVSTPWTEHGLLWDYYQIGTRGRHLSDPVQREAHAHTVVFKGPSPVLNNPTIIREALAKERATDSEAFRRETLAEFSKSVSGFLPTALLRRAADRQPRRRPAVPGVWYTAAIDPAFRGDAFAISIGHMEAHPSGQAHFVQDYCDRWVGSRESPLNPALVLSEVARICREYGIATVMSDQHQQDGLMQLALDYDLIIEPFTLTPKTKTQVFQDFLTLINQDRVRLLDYDDLLHEFETLEKTLTAGGNVKIKGRGTAHDDLAIVTAMCLHRALAYGIAAEPTTDTVEDTTPAGIKAVLAERYALAHRPKRGRTQWWNR